MKNSVFTSCVLAAAMVAVGCGSSVETGTGGAGGSGTGGHGTGATGHGGQGTGAASPCPATEPANGPVSCTGVTPGFRCTYGDSVRPECRHDWICTAGVWTTTKNICLEPAPGSCAATEPAQNTMCNGTEGAVCTYGDDICICSACTGGPCMQSAVWSCAKPPTTAGCPKTVPNDGSVCDAAGTTCTYGFPCSSSGVTVTCSNGGTWSWQTDVACPL